MVEHPPVLHELKEALGTMVGEELFAYFSYIRFMWLKDHHREAMKIDVNNAKLARLSGKVEAIEEMIVKVKELKGEM